MRAWRAFAWRLHVRHGNESRDYTVEEWEWKWHYDSCLCSPPPQWTPNLPIPHCSLSFYQVVQCKYFSSMEVKDLMRKSNRRTFSLQKQEQTEKGETLTIISVHSLSAFGSWWGCCLDITSTSGYLVMVFLLFSVHKCMIWNSYWYSLHTVFLSLNLLERGDNLCLQTTMYANLCSFCIKNSIFSEIVFTFWFCHLTLRVIHDLKNCVIGKIRIFPQTLVFILCRSKLLEALFFCVRINICKCPGTLLPYISRQNLLALQNQ